MFIILKDYHNSEKILIKSSAIVSVDSTPDGVTRVSVDGPSVFHVRESVSKIIELLTKR